MTPFQKARPLAISMGDPAGIGAEIILRAAARQTRTGGPSNLLVIGDIGVMREAAARLPGVPDPVEWEPDASPRPAKNSLAVMRLSDLPAAARRPGRPTVQGADAAYRYVVEGARMALAAEVSGLVTAPISKEWVNRAGHKIPGHTELLASLSGTRLWRMMFIGRTLRLALVTVHIGLARVPRALTIGGVFDTIRLLARHLHEGLGMGRPRIAVLGLNPHAGENGLFGNEEERVIIPAIKQARRARIDAIGPLPPDTAFARPSGEFGFDAAVAMYHDQGLIALKALEFDSAVNVTLGLPFVRTSPDHGTAFDIAGSGRANPASMIAAIDYARQASTRRVLRRTS
jgi:4-hydroxythreonine-4-phosphate dehydrogenase